MLYQKGPSWKEQAHAGRNKAKGTKLYKKGTGWIKKGTGWKGVNKRGVHVNAPL